MDATLEGALARVFGGALPPAGTAAAPRVPEEAEGSGKVLLEAAASALTRASEELRRVGELLQRLRDAGGR